MACRGKYDDRDVPACRSQRARGARHQRGGNVTSSNDRTTSVCLLSPSSDPVRCWLAALSRVTSAAKVPPGGTSAGSASQVETSSRSLACYHRLRASETMETLMKFSEHLAGRVKSTAEWKAEHTRCLADGDTFTHEPFVPPRTCRWYWLRCLCGAKHLCDEHDRPAPIIR
jgi:hypothetical protein